MMHFITKATTINNINSKCYIKKLKSSRTCLIGYSCFILREWFLIAQGWTYRQTDIHTDFLDKRISRNNKVRVLESVVG